MCTFGIVLSTFHHGTKVVVDFNNHISMESIVTWYSTWIWIWNYKLCTSEYQSDFPITWTRNTFLYCLSHNRSLLYFQYGYLFILGIVSFLFSLLHITWSILLNQGMRKQHYGMCLYCIGVHVGASFLSSILSTSINGGCWIVIGGLLGILCMNGLVIYYYIRKLKQE
jgi:hypothetical protein